jgi:hypothetical protein
MKVIFWIVTLIGIYLLVSYYKGTVAVAKVASDFFTKTILFLQGRDAQGHVGGYAKE